MYMDLALAQLAQPKEERSEAVPSCTAATVDDNNSGCCSGSVVVDAGDSPPERLQDSWRGVERMMLGDGLGSEWGFNHFIHWDAVEAGGSAGYDEGEGVVVQEEFEGMEEEEGKIKAEVVDDEDSNMVWHWHWGSGLNPLQQQPQPQQQQGSLSLNLSLNYQEVLDAWSGRWSLWADCCSDTGNGANHHRDYHALEVPTTTVDDREEKEKRRARVMKYREKRHCRLFSKKITYEVRRLNAEKRPRLKGRFVKTN